MSMADQGDSSSKHAIPVDTGPEPFVTRADSSGVIRVRPFAPRWLPAVILLLVGFSIRLWTSTVCHLNPDEALHYHTANQPTIQETYAASTSKAHPPLFFLILHFWMYLGTSEATLRSLSVLAGTFALWGGYRWIVRLFGEPAGLIGMGILTFAPMMISLSTEVRHYALLLWFETFALIAVEDICSTHSRRAIGRFAIWQALALGTHYSAVWLLGTLTIYATWRLMRNKAERRVLAEWGLAVGAMALIVILLVVTHVSQLSGSGLEQSAVSGWLKHFYFHPETETLWHYLRRNTLGLFVLLFGMLPDFRLIQEGKLIPGVAATYVICVMLIAMFVVSLGLVTFRIVKIGPLGRPFYPKSRSRPVDAVVLLTLPILIAAAAGIGGRFPYGSTRHVAYLLPILAAGLSIFPAHLLRDRRRTIVAGWMLFGPLWVWVAATPGPYNNPRYHKRQYMELAVHYIHDSIAPQRPLLMDGQSFEVMSYYLNQGQSRRLQPRTDGFAEAIVGGRRAIVVHSEWSFTAENYPDVVNRLHSAAPELHGRVAWVVGQSWGDFYGTLVDRLPPELCRNVQRFGDGLVVFLTPF